MITALILPERQRAQLVGEAERAFPAECCGLVEGVVVHATAHATALHPARNLAAAPDRFEIDPAVHIALLRSLRGTERSVVGCYHSHPNGSADPSQRDRESASEVNFLWLIAALKAGRAPHIAAYVSTGDDFVLARIVSSG